MISNPTNHSPDQAAPGPAWSEATHAMRAEMIERAISGFAASKANAALQRGAVLSRVSGPFLGYFVASYAKPLDGPEQGFVGEYRICQTEPSSYWEAGTPFSGECAMRDATAQAALGRADALAATRIGELLTMDLQAAD